MKRFGVLIRLGRVIYVGCFVLAVGGTAFIVWPNKALTTAEIGCADGTVWTVEEPDGRLQEKTGKVPKTYIEYLEIDGKVRKLSRHWVVSESSQKDDYQACGLCTKRPKGKFDFNECGFPEVWDAQKAQAFWFNTAKYTYRFVAIKDSAKFVGIVAGIALAVLEGLRMILSYILFGEIAKPFWWRPFAKERR